jgi:hypothetical protein
VVRCAIYEVGRVLAARGRILEATNRQYREWATAQEEALVPTATEVRRGSMNHPRSARANRLSQWSMVRELSDVPRALLTTVRVVPRQHFDRHERE